MISLKELRDLAAGGDLTDPVKERALAERATLMSTLVGNLYPSILQDEIDAIAALPSRPTTVFDYVRED